jgi:flagellar basal-body rod protein FlgC
VSIFSSLKISATGLTAQRLRMSVIANNIANMNTTRTPDGTPYRRQFAVFAPVSTEKSTRQATRGSNPAEGRGVAVVGVLEDRSPARLVYDPGHPDANREGYVSLPNIDPVREMVDMISASRAYEANVTAINAAKTMAMRALDIGRA